MNKYEVQIKENNSKIPNKPHSVFVRLVLIDINNIKDRDEVKKKIEEINIAASDYYFDDIETIEFSISYDNKSIWSGTGSIINQDDGQIVYRIKVKKLIRG